jgi:hypothetical protein
VEYTIRAKDGLASGARLDAQARSYFDSNPPIDTPAINNTIDAGDPQSTVQPLPDFTPGTAVTLNWLGTDEPGGSGVRSYDVYVSENGGPFVRFQHATTETSAVFVGRPQHVYAFYSVATDQVGHVELAPLNPDATTRLDASGALTARFEPIEPDARLSALTQVSLQFSAPVSDFTVQDLRLVRTDDAPVVVSLVSATLATNDGQRWTISGLSRVTEPSGRYELRLVPSEQGVHDALGRRPEPGVHLRWRMRPGDATLDGVFDSTDLIAVFTRGEYEDDQPNNSTWSDGDWDGDGEMTTADLVAAFQAGGYDASREEFPRGDFNRDGQLTAADIDLLFRQLRLPSPHLSFDLTADGRVDVDDRDELVQGILRTNYGDANLDGLFDSSDLVQVFREGQFEDAEPMNGHWASGDWDGDGDTTTSDLVLALQSGAYLSGRGLLPTQQWARTARRLTE